MTDFKHNDLHSLPKPAKGRGGVAKLGMYTLAALVLTSGALYWLSRDEEDKKHITSAVKENVQTAVKNTPLQSVVSPYLDEKKNSANASLTNPRTAPGTLAGQNVQAKMSAPPSLAPEADIKANSASPDSSGGASGDAFGDASGDLVSASDTSSLSEMDTMAATSVIAPSPKGITPVAPKVQQDSKVPLSFVDDMASWLVTRYNPKGGISRHLSAANLRYGQNLRNLNPQGEGNVQGARATLLRYAFNSTMMSALYNLYAEHFVQSMAQAASAKAPKNTSAQKVLDSYATEFSTLGSVLQGLGTMDDFSKRMQAIENSVQETLTIHNKLTEAIFAFDAAVEENKSDVAETLQLRIDGLNAQYQRSLHNRTLATESLLAAVRQKAPAANRIDGDSILFLAQWLERRVDQGQKFDAMQQSASTAGELLQDLATKLRKAPTVSAVQPNADSAGHSSL